MPEQTQKRENALNDQITDSINAIRKSIESGGVDNVETYTQQILAHSVGLALLNAVHQQQQRYILQNAITTAAESRPAPTAPPTSEEQLRAAEESMKAATAAVAASVNAVQQSVESMAKQLQEHSENGGS